MLALYSKIQRGNEGSEKIHVILKNSTKVSFLYENLSPIIIIIMISKICNYFFPKTSGAA